MKHTNLLKLSLATVVAALALGAGSLAHANPGDGTYVFNAVDGKTHLDGSSITILNGQFVDWTLLDSSAASYNPYPPTSIPLTPNNSQQDPNDPYTGVFGDAHWAFRIITLNPTLYTNDGFSGQDNLEGVGPAGGTGTLYSGFGDPEGNWTLKTTAVPDASATSALLALGLIPLFAGRSLRRRSALAQA